MTSILDLLSDGAHDRALVTFVGRDTRFLTFQDIWRQSDGASAWFAERTTPGETIAAVLNSTPECLAVLVGAWRAGLRVASLPHASRAMGFSEYVAQLSRLVDSLDARWLFAERPGSTSSSPLVFTPFAAAYTDKAPIERDGACFVQFSSGSTGQPKGVELRLQALAANVGAILDTMGPPDGLSLCSWLPLSHDMGLVGSCLSTWAGSGRRWSGRGHLVLIDSSKFVTSPTSWLRWISTQRCQVTAVPNFALDLVARRLEGSSTQLDLSGLEICIVGSEPVRAATLERFAAVTASFGFDPRAFCPAYGMAEASLAVTLTPPDHQWRCLRLDQSQLDVGKLSFSADGQAFVSAGHQVQGMRVRIAEGEPIGPIEIAGLSLFDRYVGSNPAITRSSDGWFRTNDLGFIHEDELFVAGRVDDVISIAGRNVYATELEEFIGRVDGIRQDCCAVVTDEEGGYLVLAERQRGSRFKNNLPEISRAVRLASVRLWGVGPREILLLAPATFPKTPSGKLQRMRLREAVSSGDLAVDMRQRFGAGAAS
jgi:acyl-CoA synthetase (AMP-forming)/AMP-acid ligase II